MFVLTPYGSYGVKSVNNCYNNINIFVRFRVNIICTTKFVNNNAVLPYMVAWD